MCSVTQQNLRREQSDGERMSVIARFWTSDFRRNPVWFRTLDLSVWFHSETDACPWRAPAQPDIAVCTWSPTLGVCMSPVWRLDEQNISLFARRCNILRRVTWPNVQLSLLVSSSSTSMSSATTATATFWNDSRLELLIPLALYI